MLVLGVEAQLSGDLQRQAPLGIADATLHLDRPRPETHGIDITTRLALGCWRQCTGVQDPVLIGRGLRLHDASQAVQFSFGSIPT